MNSLKQFLFTKPREESGARTANRFDYQLNYGLLLLIKNYKNLKNFYIIFDYHDDIAKINVEDNDYYNFDFYQVKTKKDHNMHDFSSIFKIKKNTSIVLKILDNFKLFRKNINSLNIISNVKLKLNKNKTFKKKEKYFDEINFLEYIKEIKISELNKNNIVIDYNYCSFFSKFYYHKSELSLTNYSDIIKGKLNDIIYNDYGKNLSSTPLYLTLLSEAKIKNNRENFNPNHEEDINKISISKEDFVEYINNYINRNDTDKISELKNIIIEMMNLYDLFDSNALKPIEKCILNETIDKFLPIYYSHSNETILSLIKIINKKMDKINFSSNDVKKDINKIITKIKNKSKTILENYGKYTIEILFIMEFKKWYRKKKN